MKKLFTVFCLFALLLTVSQCENKPDRNAEGRELANTYCSTCHMVPHPEDLTRQIWINHILPLMGAFYGIYDRLPRSKYLKDPTETAYLENVYPVAPTLDSASWAAIKQYYIDESPDVLSPPPPAPQLLELTRFNVQPVYGGPNDPLRPFTTMIAVDEKTKRIYAGGRNGNNGVLRSFSLQHELVDIRPLPSPAAFYWPEKEAVLEMGSLLPTDIPLGRLTYVSDTTGEHPIMDSLLRAIEITSIDLDLDGQQETVLGEYGNMTGRLRAIAPDGNNTILSATPGAIRLRKGDLDKDGHEDLFVLFAQGDERVEVYLARPGKPERKRLARFPPSYGSSDMEVIDFDKDGDLDLLLTNGDNYDYQPVPKAYHGIRLLENDGNANFSESWFYHLDGAFGVEVDDFDGDGDNDIAAIAYFVEAAKRSLYSFVYLEQQEKLRFQPYGIRKPVSHFYICLTKGDPDLDGDQDLLLGNFSGYLPDGGTKLLEGDAPVYVFMENKTK